MDGVVGVMLWGLAAYLAVGIVFAVVFVLVGAQRVDHNARGGPVGFRVMILPGAAALWPLLLVKWVRS